jgi:hypothetical protein
LAATYPGIPIIFLDDFVGTGLQFETTWTRRHILADGLEMSYEMLAREAGAASLYYCPLLVTSVGLQSIQDRCKGVIVSPGHVLGPRYSALAADSVLWPRELLGGAAAFIKRTSLAAGMPDTAGSAVNDWAGFHGLGLALAFAHGTPDAALGMFSWSENGWRPLVKRA